MGGADVDSNLQSLCHEHHRIKTAKEAKDRGGVQVFLNVFKRIPPRAHAKVLNPALISD
jgi:hypothetical protein